MLTSGLAGNAITDSLPGALLADVTVPSAGDLEVVADLDDSADHSGAELREELLRVVRRYGLQLTLDLNGVTFRDWAGAGAVVLASRRMGARRPGLALCPADDYPRWS